MMFHRWSLTDNSYAAARLYFANSTELILEDEPYEEAMVFFYLSPNRLEALGKIDPFLVERLDFSRNRAGRLEQ